MEVCHRNRYLANINYFKKKVTLANVIKKVMTFNE